MGELYTIYVIYILTIQNALSKHAIPMSADNTNWNALLLLSIQTLELVIAIILSLSNSVSLFFESISKFSFLNFLL